MTTATMSEPNDLEFVYGVTTCSLLDLMPLLRAAEEIGDYKTVASIVSAMTLLAPPGEAPSREELAA
jgi:hypothetical protein